MALLERFKCAVLCLALAAFCAAGLTRPAEALTYRWVEVDTGRCQPTCPVAIAATGQIGGDDVEKLVTFFRNGPQGRKFVPVLFIHSPGGVRETALRLGRGLRSLKLTVVVAQVGDSASRVGAGACNSACVYLLASGVRRVVLPGGHVGVHSPRLIQPEFHDRLTGTVTQNRFDRDGLAQADAAYYRSMGVSPDLARIAFNTPHSSVYTLSPPEMARLRLARERL